MPLVSLVFLDRWLSEREPSSRPWLPKSAINQPTPPLEFPATTTVEQTQTARRHSRDGSTFRAGHHGVRFMADTRTSTDVTGSSMLVHFEIVDEREQGMRLRRVGTKGA